MAKETVRILTPLAFEHGARLTELVSCKRSSKGLAIFRFVAADRGPKRPRRQSLDNGTARLGRDSVPETGPIRNVSASAGQATMVNPGMGLTQSEASS